MRNLILTAGLGLAIALGATAADAAVSQDKAAKLGTTLTPIGANPEGNKAGTIPKWIGKDAFSKKMITLTREEVVKLRQRVVEFGEKHADEMNLLTWTQENGLSDLKKAMKMVPAVKRLVSMIGMENLKPRFVITADNYKQYTDRLAAGHERLFELYPETYKMIVYPSVRPSFFPQEIRKWTQYNATHAKLEGCPDCITGAKVGFPFPIPQGGAQVIWNHKLKFRGSAIQRTLDSAVVNADGSYHITKAIQDIKLSYANLQIPADQRNENLIAYFLQQTTYPPRVAGQFTLVHEVFGKNTSGRNAWIYNPGLGRVTRAPNVGFDNPSIGSDGLMFNDQVNMYNGSLQLYNWKLRGKKAMFIPYNSYLLSNPIADYDDIIGPNHINQGMARYELHRVWVVEATLRKGASHQFAKRVFYVDEDSWTITLVDCYDNRGELWRFQEGHLVTYPFLPITTPIPHVIYDLKSGRYYVTALNNEGGLPDWTVEYRPGYFRPSNLKQIARLR